MPLLSNQVFDLIVVGGGAAGFMAAITAAEKCLCSVLVLEASSHPLEKVRISGGGRCNVTHACWDPTDLSVNYPRGKKFVLHSFRKFAAGDAVSWFSERGVDLVTEIDGRMFPSSNSSGEIISCLRNSAKSAGVQIQTKVDVIAINNSSQNNFFITSRDGSVFNSRIVLLATGGAPGGRKIALSLGHQIVPPLPSLFSFQLNDDMITSCSGLALDNVDLVLSTTNKTFHEKGRFLITHWGCSGPSILRLSSFAARDLAFDKYKAKLKINWVNLNNKEMELLFKNYRNNHGKKSLLSFKPFPNLPRKLWVVLLNQASINSATRWSEIRKLDESKLIDVLISSTYFVKGRGPFRDEFVTAGGISLGEINLSTMESNIIKGMFFAGEVMDIDGLTGGFNFQHCWTSGWIAGLAISKEYSHLK